MTDLAETPGTTEHETLEFKRDLPNRDAIRKASCALADTLLHRAAITRSEDE